MESGMSRQRRRCEERSAEAIHASSCAGLTRASILFQQGLSKKMDCRVKPGNDTTELPSLRPQ
jgi:hypothetical protein